MAQNAIIKSFNPISKRAIFRALQGSIGRWKNIKTGFYANDCPNDNLKSEFNKDS